jgi:hypothetical protein
MSGETKRLQVDYHRMGRWIVDKKIFMALRWLLSLVSIKDHVMLVLDKRVMMAY